MCLDVGYRDLKKYTYALTTEIEAAALRLKNWKKSSNESM